MSRGSSKVSQFCSFDIDFTYVIDIWNDRLSSMGRDEIIDDIIAKLEKMDKKEKDNLSLQEKPDSGLRILKGTKHTVSYEICYRLSKSSRLQAQITKLAILD